MVSKKIIHPLEPVWNSECRALILGTMPSPKSRMVGFYYGHPQNRFWRVLAEIFGETVPNSNAEKTSFLLQHRIALWDVLKSCRICGASDQSITEPVPNDFSVLLKETEIQSIYTTGRKAFQLYESLVYPKTKIHAIALPSTSPANCRMSFHDLIDAYRVLLNTVSTK
ncbi:MAG: DNA-deoxyinosine glycosylase [Oscillospiraceae bacterium]|jgi:TDG/mug DNA glycosylase family protein